MRHPSQGPAWQGSARKARLPANWRHLRRLVLARDGGRCTWVDDGVRCISPATQVDHIVAGDDHRPANLRSLCAWHHARKSSVEGNAARRRPTERRPTPPHPGLVG
jgi:hypothetical protein